MFSVKRLLATLELTEVKIAKLGEPQFTPDEHQFDLGEKRRFRGNLVPNESGRTAIKSLTFAE